MGYTTEFEGHVTVDPPLNAAEVSFLKDFNNTRRMDRDQGPLFVGGSGFHGQGKDADVRNFNFPHRDQPGLWCQWKVSDDGTTLRWDGGEKFYQSAEWMDYIVNNLLSPKAREYVDEHIAEDWRLPSFTCDHVVNGEIFAQGEESDDRWMLIVTNNVVQTAQANFTYNDPKPL